MKKLSEEQEREQLRQRIIGLGERSLKKSYYPELQKRIRELEQANTKLEKEIKQRKKTEKLKEKLESQLRHAQKMEAIGTLAGGIAHDFNNILSAIIGYTELARIHLTGDPDEQVTLVNKDLDGVKRSASRAKDLVSQILSFSSRHHSERVPVDLKDVVADTSRMLRAMIPTTISIEQDFQNVPSLISADPTQLHQVILNLGTNGYHAMREHGGVLRFEIYRKVISKDDVLISNSQIPPGSYVVLTVSDNGCGMSRGHAERIFDPYFTTKSEQGGTGLGLSVVHGIVHQHDGFISVYTEPEKGTTFQLCFPLLRTNNQQAAEDQEYFLTRGGSERLLIVDDETELLEVMEGTLGHLGYRVTTTSSPAEAIELMREEPGSFDLLITDMNMPKMSGAELISHIREIRADLPVILCTGFSEMMNAESTGRLGRAEFVMKPITARQLNQAIRGLIEGQPELLDSPGG